MFLGCCFRTVSAVFFAGRKKFRWRRGRGVGGGRRGRGAARLDEPGTGVAGVASTFFLGCLAARPRSADAASIEWATSKIGPSRAVRPLETTTGAGAGRAEGAWEVAGPARHVKSRRSLAKFSWGLRHAAEITLPSHSSRQAATDEHRCNTDWIHRCQSVFHPWLLLLG
jgi:hypothetical protein